MKKILIICANFYPEISKLLKQGAISELKKNKAEYDIIDISGCLEIPIAISLVSQKSQYSGYIALGCIIRGETSHYDHIANECTRSISELAIINKLAIGNAILTVENIEQAIHRADPNKKNKAKSAVISCLELINIKDNFL